jgi:phosphate transport system protein
MIERPINIEGHIVKKFDGALSALHMRVIEMGGLALDQVREATRAYADWDASAANLVIERERTINSYDVTLDEEQLALIARRAPVASDLRVVIALSKAVAELERIGDEAAKIARTVLRDAARPGPATARDARELGQLAVALLRRALEAFDRLEYAEAAEVIAGDQLVDAEYAAALGRLLTRAMEDPRQFEVALHAAFALKSLERVADHARNLARQLQSIAPQSAAQKVAAPTAP